MSRASFSAHFPVIRQDIFSISGWAAMTNPPMGAAGSTRLKLLSEMFIDAARAEVFTFACSFIQDRKCRWFVVGNLHFDSPAYHPLSSMARAICSQELES